jgi:hypothetical protein
MFVECFAVKLSPLGGLLKHILTDMWTTGFNSRYELRLVALSNYSTTADRVVSGGAPKGPGLVKSDISSSWDLVEISRANTLLDLINLKCFFR